MDKSLHPSQRPGLSGADSTSFNNNRSAPSVQNSTTDAVSNQQQNRQFTSLSTSRASNGDVGNQQPSFESGKGGIGLGANSNVRKSKSTRGRPSGARARPNDPSKIRRRNRMITSCLECRRRKLKCDKLQPCSNCAKSQRDCVFLAPTPDAVSQIKLMELKEQMGSLELVLEQEVVARQKKGQVHRNDGGETGAANLISTTHQDTTTALDPNSLDSILNSVEEEGLISDDENNLKPTPLAVLDAGYDDDADDNSLDLGFKLGKLRMTDRVGGFFRPKIADELSQVLDDACARDRNTETTLNIPLKVPAVTESSAVRGFTSEGIDSCFSPGPSYIAPTSELLFGGSSRKCSLTDFLPTRAAGGRLLEQYWESVHPVARILHRPSFEKQYAGFWSNVTQGIEPPYSLQAAVFAVFFTSVISMSEHLVQSTFGVPPKKLLENFQLGTEMALGKSNFLRTSKTQTLQAMVIYMIPMCRNEISRSHSVLLGSAIRLAECMGLHRDPEEYGHGPIETHVRRMIWYQLCFLDLRTSETQGPRQSIRREDFSTKFPLNVDDRDFSLPNSGPLRDTSRWTDMTFTRIRFECHELHRLVYVDRARLDKGLISLTHLLGKIETFRKAAYAKFGPMIYVPNPKPIQRAAQLVLSVLMCRAYTSVLHRYHDSVTARTPDRLLQIIITAGTQFLEDSVELESAPELQSWAWYAGAYSQYHMAFLLLMEVWAHPMRREAHRIWRCLDYVFETPAVLPGTYGKQLSQQDIISIRSAKARFIVTQLRDRMEAYREKRKLRAPVSMSDNSVINSTTPRSVSREPTPQPSSRSTSASEVQATSYGAIEPQLFSGGKSATTSLGSLPPQAMQPMPSSHSSQHNQGEQPLQKLQNIPPAPHLHQYHQYYSNHQQPHAQFYSHSQDNYNAPQDPIYPPGHGDSVDSRGNSSVKTSGESGTGNLWFVPGADHASAGVAPPLNTMNNGAQNVQPRGNSGDDIPMLDIDWDEWDKLFPPNINNGDLNLPAFSPMMIPQGSTTDSIENIPTLPEAPISGYRPPYNAYSQS